ncbi:MAG: hypothetical protein JWN44_6431 [Myxococcales bacterium]|nr:hypothetical protein [Myxococcales bacterium]
MRALVGALAVAAMGCGSGPAAATKDGEWSCGAVHGAATAVRALGHGRRLKLGAVADTNGTAPATLANLRRFAGVFSVEHVDAVVALGDLGATEDEIATVLTALAGAKVPLLALAGEREPENAFHAAVARVRAAGVDIIDLVETRLVDTGKIDILSVPGYPFSDKGCRYTSADLEGARRLVDGRWRPLIVVAHTPPKGAGDKAVDWATGEVNAGDPAMLDLQNAIYPNAALFAHVDEAGGRNERGRINVGGVEAGMATIVELRDGVARTEVLR